MFQRLLPKVGRRGVVGYLFYIYFFLIFFGVICSLHLSFIHGCLGNIQWSRASTGLVACCSSFLECFMSTFYVLPSTSFSFLSLNSHPSNRVLSSPYELKIESKLNVDPLVRKSKYGNTFYRLTPCQTTCKGGF